LRWLRPRGGAEGGGRRKWEDWSPGRKALAIAGGAIAGFGLATLFGFVLMWLWNGLMPRIFRLPAIGYWEGWGLFILASILFKGSPARGGKGRERRGKKAFHEEACCAGEEDDGESCPS
jgi:hypothetical protein